MIHPDERDELAEEAWLAFFAAHPERSRKSWNNDLGSIEWRHGYISGRRGSYYPMGRARTPEDLRKIGADGGFLYGPPDRTSPDSELNREVEQ